MVILINLWLMKQINTPCNVALVQKEENMVTAGNLLQ